MGDEPDVRPRPGIDYPRTLMEFNEFFGDDDACWRFLERLRWPSGFVCPGCGTADQGAVSTKHLVYYLDEFTFRFNRRSSRSRGLLFYRLMRQAVQTGPTTTDELFAGAAR